MNKIAIVGAGALGQLISHHAFVCGHQVVGYFDDYIKTGDMVDNLPILGRLSDIEQCFGANKFTHLMLGVGYKHFSFRRDFFESYYRNIPFATIIHPSCIVDQSVRIGEGSFLLPGCVLDKGVEIGKNVVLNTACTIAHDSKISDHSFLGPRVVVAGFTKIGMCCMIGVNSTLIDNLSITDLVQTGGGSVVIKDIKESGLYVGVPAIKIR